MTHTVRAVLVVAIGVALFHSEFVLAENWFDSETRTCDFESPARFALPFPRKNTTTGGQVFSVPKSNLNQILAVPNGAVETSSDLSSADILRFKVAVESLKAAPQAESAALSTIGQITDFSGVFGLASKGLEAWLSSKIEAKTASVDRLIDFVTVGGQSGYQVAFRSTPVGFNPLILVLTYYQVQVGAEPRPRRWLMATCLLPLEVVLSEVTTTASGPNANNKRLTRQADGTWRQWDITDGKYDFRRYVYLEQDQAFAYFQDADDPASKTRIHLYGGPMQRNKGNSWNSLYLTTESK